MRSLEEERNLIVRRIAEQHPLLIGLLENKEPLGAYSAGLYAGKKNPMPPERSDLFKGEVRRRLESVFSPEELAAGRIDWEKDWVVNIFDHHLPLDHPFGIGANLIANMCRIGQESPPAAIVLSDSGVPYSNTMFRRGFQFYEHHLAMLSNKHRRDVVYGAGLLGELPLTSQGAKVGISGQSGEFLQEMQEQLEGTISAPGMRGSMEQISRMNHWLWPRLFEKSLRPQVPAFFYVSNEYCCAQLLIRFLLNPDHLFTRILTEPALRGVVLRAFSGIPGCWDDSARHGTEFFWMLDNRDFAWRLRMEGDRLVNREVDFELPLEPEPIAEALEKRQIYPGMFLVYGISLFHCGMMPLVGFGSLSYLTAMQKAWCHLLEPIDGKEADCVAQLDVTGFVGGPLVVWEEAGDSVREMHAFDIIFRGGMTRNYLECLGGAPLGKFLLPALPEIYNAYVHEKYGERTPLSGGDLMRANRDLLFP